MQIFDKHEGTPVGRYKTIEQLSGEDAPEMMAIIEFANTGAIKDMIIGQEYISLAGMGSRVFEKLNLAICSGL